MSIIICLNLKEFELIIIVDYFLNSQLNLYLTGELDLKNNFS